VFFGLLVVAQPVSLLVNGLQPGDFNATLASIYVLLAIPVTALLFRFHPRQLLLGVVLIFCVHGLAGLWQLNAFTEDRFPFSAVFVNPSFNVMTPDWMDVYARYVKRPFGLFPEPSSLLASTGPWLLLLIAALLGGSGVSQTNRQLPPTWLTLSGLGLLAATMIMSASGALIILAGGMALIMLALSGRMIVTRPAVLALVSVALLSVAVLISSTLTQRLDGELAQTGGSWVSRLSSLRLGIGLLASAGVTNLWFGQGAAEVAMLTQREASLDAVQSWILTYVVANGLLGAIALIACALFLVWSVCHTAQPWVWAALILAWAAGPAIVTAYNSLFGIWGFVALPLTIADQMHGYRRMPIIIWPGREWLAGHRVSQ